MQPGCVHARIQGSPDSFCMMPVHHPHCKHSVSPHAPPGLSLCLPVPATCNLKPFLQTLVCIRCLHWRLPFFMLDRDASRDQVVSTLV
jgi:hypothetical protein